MPTATRSRAAAVAASPNGPSTASTSALATASISTSEQLVKALRVPQPPANGVTKIDLALEAWSSANFFVPKKAELLSQWVLEHLCASLRASSSSSTSAPGTPNKGKNKSKQQQQNASSAVSSELDLKAWQLLSAIVTAQISADSELSEAAKRSWLSHLANTQPLLHLAGALARNLHQTQTLSVEDRETLLSSASVSLVKLLPPATSRTAATNVEAATDAICAWLDFFGQPRSTSEQQTGHAILQAIVTTWTTTLHYGSNAKRNHQRFCTTAVPSLLRALHTLGAQDPTSESNALLETVQQIAAESLFTEDVQRSLLQAGRNAEITRTPTWKESKASTSGVAQQLAGLLQDEQLNEAALSSLAILSDLLYTKLSRSEALNSIASSSATSSGSVRETQLSLVRKTMLAEWYFSLLPFLVTSSGSQSRQAQRAAARRGLLQGIETYALYVMTCDEHEEWRSLFSTLFDSIRAELRRIATDATAAAQSEIADHFNCLTSLWRLEKSVVEDDLVSIFALAAAQRVSKQALWLPEELPASTLAALDFFHAVAAIDVRFRTIPALVHSVLSSVPLASELIAQSKDTSLSTSLFTSQTFLTELGKLCRDSVTPMQVPDLLQRLTQLARGVESAVSAGGAPQAKKQRTASSSPSKARGPDDGALALIAQLQIAAKVVQSVQLTPTLRARSIAAAEELHNTLILPCLDPCLASTRTAPAPGMCGVAAAALRLRQALLAEKWRFDPSEPVKLDGSLPTESLSCLESALDERADSLLELMKLGKTAAEKADGELCQLQFHIFQSFMQRAERDSFLEVSDSKYCSLVSQDDGPICALFRELSTAVDAKHSAWTGCPNRIRNRPELMQVVWMAIVTRWAPLLESVAAATTFQTLVPVILATAQPSQRDGDAESGMRYITSTALRSAAFLELPRWRKHIVERVQESLASTDKVERRLAATAPLWVTPTEWVTRSARGSLLAKLLTLDRDIVAAPQSKAKSSVSVANWVELRSLLARLQVEYATESEVSDEDLFASLQAFLSSQHIDEAKPADEQHAWERASLAAAQATVRVLLARSKHNTATQIRLVQVAKEVRQEAVVKKGHAGRITLQMRAAQDMLATLGEDAQQADAAAAKQNVDAITKLASASLVTASDVAQTLDVALYHLREIRLLVHGASAGTDDAGYGGVLQALSQDVVGALCTVLSRGSAVDESSAALVRAAANVASELVRCIDTCGRAVAALSGRAAPLAACVAYSALVASMPALQEQRRVADSLQRIISRLEAEDYDGVLSQLGSALRSTAAASDASAVDAKELAAIDGDQAALISTIGLVLGSAPEGNSKTARSHLSHWLAVLTSSNAATGDRLRLRSMVASVSALDALCSHHAMLLRTQDMGALLQLFSTIAGPSMSDHPAAAILQLSRAELDTVRSRVFDGIVSTLGSLMRLRQDLVLSFLPQLGALLARLCTLFRRLRRSRSGHIEASGLQRRALRRELPAWLDPEHVTPLSADVEARALARLLSALIVKHVSLKNRSADAPAVKAESLARPFSKHATYVLVAYLRSLTAPHSVVPADVRAELEVGMMTVCGIIGHHQRDAAMIGLLDSAGKVLLKRVWAEYEKQRYKGQ